MRWAGGSLPDVVAGLFDARPIASAPVDGGTINQAYRIRLDNATTVFAKTRSATGPHAAPGLFVREAAGLAWLRETNTVRVPKVLAARDEPGLAHRFLVLEWIEPGRPAVDHDERFGRALAALHRFGAPRFGLDHDNDIGALAQPNAPGADADADRRMEWPAFLRAYRLEPLLRRGFDDGLLPLELRPIATRVLDRLAELTGPPEPPARLHGDLWGGNAIVDAAGQAVVIDPAVYGGHREMDLAMMRLFGGFGPRVFDAYDEAFPLAEGHAERVELCQLYPLLVHVHLFPGHGYGATVRRILEHHGR